jgi:asparagine synthase (glutamine-hydrolysing)
MFAYALWDATARTLFLARDRAGEKPLLYATLPDGTVLFGSELKALTAHPGLPRRLDPAALEEFLAYGYIPDPRTIYQHVAKLEAGHSLTWTRGSEPILRRYWDIPAPPLDRRPLAELGRDLAARLTEAVSMQLMSEVPLGAFLSGGVDSGGIVATMAGLMDQPVDSFSIGFSDPAFDESAEARSVAERYATRHRGECMAMAPDGAAERLAAIYDEPFGDSSALPTLAVAALARRHVTVALSGDGGDEVFAGYRRYGFHQREESLRRLLPQGLRGPVFGTLARIYPRLDRAPRWLRARHTFGELARDGAGGFFANVAVMDDPARARLRSAAFDRELQGHRACAVLRRHMAAAPSEDPLAQAQYADFKTWLPGDILTKVDRAAMACSLEVRIPMLDHVLVEWAAALPPEAKRRGGSGKLVLKQALEPLLPRDLLHRRKQGFSVPLAQWFRGALAPRAEELVTGGRLAATGFFDMAEVSRLAAAHGRGDQDNARPLWLLTMVDAFLKRAG